DKGLASIAPLTAVAKEDKAQLARIHAIWGLGQIGRKDTTAYNALLPLTEDADAEVRVQAAKVFGDGRYADSFAKLVPLLKDAEPRVQFYAAQALGRLGKK